MSNKKSVDTKSIFTYQARLTNLSAADDAVLSAYASLHGKVERSLFARLEANKTGLLSDQSSADSDGLQGEDPGFILKATNNAIKREFLIHYGLTGRQFNAISFGLKGKIAAITALRPRGHHCFNQQNQETEESHQRA